MLRFDESKLRAVAGSCSNYGKQDGELVRRQRYEPFCLGYLSLALSRDSTWPLSQTGITITGYLPSEDILNAYVCTYTHIHTYAYIHVHTHTYKHIHTNTYIHIHTHTYTYIHIHTYIRAYVLTYFLSCVCIYTYIIHMCIHIYVYMYICMYVCMHGCMHVYDHASFNSSGLSKSLLKTKNPAQMTAYRLLDYARTKRHLVGKCFGFQGSGNPLACITHCCQKCQDPETPIPLNEGIYLKLYSGPYYNLRYIPLIKGCCSPLNPKPYRSPYRSLKGTLSIP